MSNICRVTLSCFLTFISNHDNLQSPFCAERFRVKTSRACVAKCVSVCELTVHCCLSEPLLGTLSTPSTYTHTTDTFKDRLFIWSSVVGMCVLVLQL